MARLSRFFPWNFFLDSRPKKVLLEEYKMPEICRKNHTSKHPRCHCNKITKSDALSFREKIYSVSNDHKLQNQFVAKFLRPTPVKKNVGTQGDRLRLVTNSYFVPKESGKEVQVCNPMFLAVTGLSWTRVKRIYRGSYKKEFLLKGKDTELDKSKETSRKIQKILAAKKEKLLALNQGDYDDFVKAFAGQQEDEDSDQVSFSLDVEIILSKKIGDLGRPSSKCSQKS
jgi:hypothetical protein